MKHFAQNNEVFSNYLVMLEERYQETEYDLMEELRDKISTIEQLQETQNQM